MKRLLAIAVLVASATNAQAGNITYGLVSHSGFASGYSYSGTIELNTTGIFTTQQSIDDAIVDSGTVNVL